MPCGGSFLDSLSSNLLGSKKSLFILTKYKGFLLFSVSRTPWGFLLGFIMGFFFSPCLWHNACKSQEKGLLKNTLKARLECVWGCVCVRACLEQNLILHVNCKSNTVGVMRAVLILMGKLRFSCDFSVISSQSFPGRARSLPWVLFF